MFLPWDGPLRINLETSMRKAEVNDIGSTHYFSVQEMFPDHHCINGSRVVESKEGKASRPTASIAHDCASLDLTKLREVGSQAVYNVRF